MKRTRQLLFLICVLVLLLASCTGTASQVSRTADDWADVEVRRIQRIRIGVALSTSGPGSEVEARDVFQAAELAAQDAGLIHGYQIELVKFNTQCSSAGGRSAALSIVNDPTLITVIGPTCNEACEASAPIFDSAHYTFVSPSCSGENPNNLSTNGGPYLHTMYDSRLDAEVAAYFAYAEVGARHALLIDDGRAVSAANLVAFETSFLDLGGRADRLLWSNTSSSADQTLDALTSGSFDLIYAPLPVDTASDFINSVSSSDFVDVPIIGGQQFLSRWLLDTISITPVRLYAVGPTLASPEYLAMSQSFSRAYGIQPDTIQAAYTYDAVRIAIKAIDAVAIPQPNGTLVIGRSAVRSALYSTAAHKGLTGVLTCSISGDCSGSGIGISEVINGQWSLVYVP